MTAELFPTDIRGIAHSISYSIANLLMFAALQSYRDLQAFLGGTILEIFIALIHIIILSIMTSPLLHLFLYIFVFLFFTQLPIYSFFYLILLNV